MRRFVVLAVFLLALAPAFATAQAAGDKGSVQRSWISRTSGGDAEKSFSAKGIKRLYANFVWKVPAKAGQTLKIEWHDPSGALSAVWTSKTLKSDKQNTRLYAWVGRNVVKGKGKIGTWHALLLVGGKRIGTSKFHIGK
jgi:hypothetical protein